MFIHKTGAPSILLPLTGALTKSPYIVFRRLAGPTVGPTTSPFSRVRVGRRVPPGARVYNLQTSLDISSGYDERKYPLGSGQVLGEQSKRHVAILSNVVQWTIHGSCETWENRRSKIVWEMSAKSALSEVATWSSRMYNMLCLHIVKRKIPSPFAYELNVPGVLRPGPFSLVRKATEDGFLLAGNYISPAKR
eukprot:8096422-Pyramimonas_sp.AAC.1